MFDDRLKRLREARGLTQEQTADNLGIPLRTYRSYETDTREPNSGVLIKIAKFFGVTTDYLLNYNVDIQAVETKQQTEKYLKLDTHGKKMVDFVINEEFARCTENKSTQKTLWAARSKNNSYDTIEDRQISDLSVCEESDDTDL